MAQRNKARGGGGFPRAEIVHGESGAIMVYLNTPDGPRFAVNGFGGSKAHFVHGVSRWDVFGKTKNAQDSG